MVNFIEVHLPLIHAAMMHKPDLPIKFNWWFSIPVIEPIQGITTNIVRGCFRGVTIEWSSESIHVVRNWESRYRNKELSDFHK